MSTYAIEDHELKLNSNFSQLSVIRKSDNAQVGSFSLSSVHQLKCLEDDYVITTSTSGSGFVQAFDSADQDTLIFSARTGLGISDLRVVKNGQPVRGEFTYHLDVPMLLLHLDGVLTVESPCEPPCTAPIAEACTIVELA